METEEPSVQAKIGQMAAVMMEFAEEHSLDELTIGGIVLAGKTGSGTNIVLTRTTEKDPFACMKMWASAADIEIDGTRHRVSQVLEELRQLRDDHEQG